MADLYVSDNLDRGEQKVVDGPKPPERTGVVGDSDQRPAQSGRLYRDEKEYSEVMQTERPTGNPLAAFVVRPKDMVFESQDKDEKILLLLRRHPITNVKWILTAVLLAFVPMLFELVPPFLQLPFEYQVMTILIWYLMLFGFLLEGFLSWYFHVYIITDERVIDYDFFSLMYKRVTMAKIDKIEDVTYEMGGALRSMFRFGHVFMQTAGETRELDFEDVSKPEVVVKLLNELMLEEEKEKLEGRVR